MMELISPQGRCVRCFSGEISQSRSLCKECQKKLPDYDYRAFACEYEGPVRALASALDEQDRPYLAQSISSLLFLQWNALSWELPDYITVAPQPFLKSLKRGYHPQTLIAKELALLMKRAFHPAILALDYADVEGNGEKLLSSLPYRLIKEDSVEDKVVLLVDTVCKERTSFEQQASALRVGRPKRIYTLALCGI